MNAYSDTSKTLAAYLRHNPRALRIIKALVASRFVWREGVDHVAGVSNGPEEVRQLRNRGLKIPCQRVCMKDRDGRATHPGRYSLTHDDRSLLQQVLAYLQEGAE